MTSKGTAYLSNREGDTIMEDSAFGFQIVLHYPDNTQVLEKRVAQAHAEAVLAKVNALNCSIDQKRALIDAIIASR